MRFRTGVFSWAVAMFVILATQELHAKGVSNVVRGKVSSLLAKVNPLQGKVLQKMTAMGAAAVIACAGLTGCNQAQEVVVNVVDVDDLADDYLSQYVTFEIDGVRYEGYLESTPEGQLLVEIDSDNSRIVLLEQIDGYQEYDHPDIGRDVYMLGEKDGWAIYRHGTLVRIYDNGYRAIEIGYESYVDDGEIITLFQTYAMLTHESIVLEDGGFAFED